MKRLFEVAGVRKLRRHFVKTVLQAFPMSESFLPLIDSKLQTEASTSRPQRSPVEAFVAANARKLAVLLALFLTGCLGLGAKHWIDNKETNLDISKVVSSHQVQP